MKRPKRRTETRGRDGGDEKLKCAEEVGRGLRWLWVDVVSIITHHIAHECKRKKDGEGDGEKEKTEERPSRDQNKQRLDLKNTRSVCITSLRA